jgi:hypothetical protein
MKLDLSAVVGGAWSLWRRDRAVLVPIAGIFLLLPTMAATIWMAAPAPSDPGAPADLATMVETMQRYVSANLPWLLLQTLLGLFGTGAILALYLDPAHPTVGGAMGSALRRFPALLLAQIGVQFAVVLGLLAFALPGLYAIGRSFLIPAAILAEPRRGATDAIARGIQLTAGNAFALLGLQAVFYFVGQLLVMLGTGFLTAGASNPVPVAIGVLVVGLANGGMALAYALLRVTAYRQAAGSGG